MDILRNYLYEELPPSEPFLHLWSNTQSTYLTQNNKNEFFFLPDQNWSCLGGSLWSWWPRWPLHGGDPKVGSWGESSWRGQIVFRTPHETPRTCCLSFIFFYYSRIDWRGTGQNARAFFKVPTQPKSSHKIERWSSCVPKWLHEETSVEKKNTYSSACALSQLGQALSPTFALLI